MIRTLFRYGVTITVIGFFLILLMETVIMPAYTRHGENRYLVNVEDRLLERALSILHSEGFRGTVEDTLYSNHYESNTVVDQYPAPNTRVKPGRTIRLKISQPEKLVEVPNLVGHSQRSAEIILQQAGLVIDTVFTEYNPDYPENTVAWQSPKGGDFLKKGFGVHLTISKGMPPNFFQVPNLFGLSKTKAQEELQKAGLTLGKIQYQQNEDLVPYTVLAQSISEGTVLEKPQPIDVTVSVLDMQDIFNQMMEEN